MRGIVIRQDRITRADLRANPAVAYVFGDNIEREGLGGQAAAMRGEPNAIGIPTKWSPGRMEGAYFRDDDFEFVKPLLDLAFRELAQILDNGYDVVIPSTGIGTGLAGLRERAPLILAYIEEGFARLAGAQTEERS